MLAKLLFCDGGDFERSLRRRQGAALALLAVGLVGLACYFLLVPNSSLPDFAQGFYLGAAGGISAGAVILLCRTRDLLTHPAARKKVRIKETDERERTILHAAFEWAGILTFFLVAAALFVVLPLNPAAFQALFAVLLLYVLAFAAANLYFSKKL